MPYRFDPELVGIVESLPLANITDLEAARAGLAGMLESFNAEVDVTGLRIDDREVPGPAGAPPVPVRVYRPEGTDTGLPALLTIHGGGFVMGSMAMEHPAAAQYAKHLGAVVVAVEYRLAPEHPYPAGLEDCYAALSWLAAHTDELGVDPSRIAVGGQSAGGGLTAAVALLARDRGGPAICFQLLGIPELDDRLQTPSMRAFVDTPMWSRPNVEISWRSYLGDLHGGDVPPYAAPARATDLSGLPPAYVSTMEFDPLRDEGIIYAMRLMEAGVNVELHSFPGTFHGSAVVRTAAVSKRGNVEMLDALRRGLA